VLVLPTSVGNRAASRKSKSYVGQAVLVLEGKAWRDLEAMFPSRKTPRSRSPLPVSQIQFMHQLVRPELRNGSGSYDLTIL
jgi:hypothetical protein